MPRFPATSPTTDSLTAYAISAARQRAIVTTGPVHHLHIGDTWLPPLEAARSENQRLQDDPQLHCYAPVQGMPSLLDAIERKLELRDQGGLTNSELATAS